MHRKIAETVDYNTFTLSHAYTYYRNGRKKSFTGPDGITYSYTYNENNQLASVHIPSVGSITWPSYTWSRPDSVVYPGGTRRTLTYDPLMRIKEITVTDPAENVIMSRAYVYDPMDNILRKDTEHGTYDYDYDYLYQLTQAANPTLPDESYTYDKVGNRLTSA